MEEKKSGVVVILLILVLAGLAALVYVRLVKKPAEGVSIEKIQEREGVAVVSERPVRRDFTEFVICDARMDAAARYMFRASIAGVVEKVNVDVGDSVEKDQVLVEFRKTELQARVLAAKAVHEEAKTNLERYRVLLEKGGVFQGAVDARKTAYENAAAALKVVESYLSFAEIRSSVGGDVHVEARWVEPGEEKGMGKELLSLVDLTELDVKASVPESAVSFIKEGGTAGYRLEGENAWRTGTITRVSPTTRHPNRFFDVFMRVKNEKRDAGWLMRPGMYAQVRISAGSHEDELAVSAAAVKRKGGREYLFVIDRSVPDEPAARRVDVQTGLRREGYIQIVKGDIDQNSIVISTPRDDLKDGDRVRLAGT